jgi:hypothetical protein
MKVLLAMIFACVGLGLLAPRFGPRQQALVATFAVAMTALYFLTGTRYM